VGGAAFPEYSNCSLRWAVVVAASAVVVVEEAEMEENVDRGERKEGLVLGLLNPMTVVVSWESAAAHTKPAIADRTRFLDGFIIVVL
jgi:hypothetical protein